MTTKKLFVFDIDGTLCDLNQPVQESLVSVLKEISQTHQLAFASGKPFGYIAGLARQLGIENCLIIGENGGSIMHSAGFPPSSYEYASQASSLTSLFNCIRKKLVTQFGQTIWFQPNEVNLTVFPLVMKDIANLHQYCQQFEDPNIDIYYHKDSVDFVPAGINKGTALLSIIKHFDFQLDNVYVFGDGENDAPMFKIVKNSVIIGDIFFDSTIHLERLKKTSDLPCFLKNLLKITHPIIKI